MIKFCNNDGNVVLSMYGEMKKRTEACVSYFICSVADDIAPNCRLFLVKRENSDLAKM